MMETNTRWRMTALLMMLALSWGVVGPPASNAISATRSPAQMIAELMEVAVQVAAGGDHTCVLTSTSAVKCWGDNEYGQLGNGSNLDSPTPVDVVGLSSGVSAISAGGRHTCALTNVGAAKCWGDNGKGQLGNGSTMNSSIPVDVFGLSSGVSAISAGNGLSVFFNVGGYHTCALTNAGAMKCWGLNEDGQLGNGSNVNSSIPVNVTSLSAGVSAIGAGGYHSCALTNTGSVECWGRNSEGQLGNGSNVNSSTPVNVASLSGGVSAISVGWYHTCVLTDVGSVKCWGSGYLGNGSFAGSSTPVDVVGLNKDVSAISVGEDHACALLNSGAVKCWGNNGEGQLGNGSTADTPTPVDVLGLNNGVSAISAGGRHVCAVISAGAIKCWGHNDSGQLGNRGDINAHTPVDVVGLGSGVSDIGAGFYHTCALTHTGAVKCWGHNKYGQLGDNSTANSQTPVDVVGLDSGVSALSVGWYQSCALTSAGAVKCWGYSGEGQVGNGSMSDSSTPVDVMGLSSGVMAISAGGRHTCALTVVGAVKCWGDNRDGQLGNGNTITASTPVDVIGIDSQVIAISAGGFHTCALTISGAVKCWGSNTYGELGISNSPRSLTPVDVFGLSAGIRMITAGWSHTCALTVANSAKCWGNNYAGQLGDGTTTSSFFPIDVSGLNAGVRVINAGDAYTCAVTNAGAAKCWGINDAAQLGNVSTVNAAIPTDVIGSGSGVSTINAGVWLHTCAVMITGAAKCWGTSYEGQLGDGKAWRTTPQNVIGFSPPEPTPTGDLYENDDTCDKATFLTANIANQTHSFDKARDADWIRIETVTGTNYTLIANDLTNKALPNFDVLTTCVTAPVASSQPSFGGEVRLPMNASDYPPGTYYVRVTNTPTTTFGNTVSYTLSFRANSNVGAAIIVAGRNGGEIYQNVITQTTDLAYIVLLRNGFRKDQILYLDTQVGRDVDGNGLADDIDATASVTNVQNAITTWAQGRVGPARPLWVYMADHGYPEQFQVSGDKSSDIITPAMLDSWLSQIETTTGVDQVNVILDACYSGSFITLPNRISSISKRGRAVMTSTSNDRVAQGRAAAANVIQRMYFGEALWSSLDANLTLKQAFDSAKSAAERATGQNQQAWLDDDGDMHPNTFADGVTSAVRGLIGSKTTGGRPSLTWTLVNTATGALIVNSHVDAGSNELGSNSVIVEVARPNSSQTFVPGELALAPHEYVTLMPAGNGQWIGSYTGFNEAGMFRLLAYGFDIDGSPSLPAEITLQLPLLVPLDKTLFLPSALQ